MRRAAASFAIALAAALLSPSEARADGDGVYGRFDGDLGLRLAGGAGFAIGGPMLAIDAGARYLCTAGLYVHYADALGSSAPHVRRSIATGVDLAPLFLARYALNAERGPAFFDLVVDSVAFGIGAFWDEPQKGPWASKPGVELTLALSFPLLGRATGPYIGLRGALRWRDGDLAAHPDGPNVIERGALLSLTLGWHHVVRTHLVDPGDGTL
ncbi:MAG: hypothetical protein QM820_31965 [Minicystis sp.]